MHTKGLVWAAMLVAMGVGTQAWGSDKSKVTVLLDNDKVKVTRFVEPTGDHMQVDSADHLVIPLTTFRSKETRDGKTEILLRQRGQAYWNKGGPRTYDIPPHADMLIVDVKPGNVTTVK